MQLGKALHWQLRALRQHYHIQAGQGCDVMDEHPTRSVVCCQHGPISSPALERGVGVHGITPASPRWSWVHPGGLWPTSWTLARDGEVGGGFWLPLPYSCKLLFQQLRVSTHSLSQR